MKNSILNHFSNNSDMGSPDSCCTAMLDEVEPYESKQENSTMADNELIDRLNALAEMDNVTRELERKKIAKEFDVRLSFIDKHIASHKKVKKVEGTSQIVQEIEPAADSVNGSELLSLIKNLLYKHVVLPSGVAEAIAVWILLTYCYDAFRILPMLGIVSPVKRCGKTTLLEILQSLTNKGLPASNITPAAIYRTIEKYHPTLLVDEADTFLKDNNELRGVLNSGHKKAMAYVVRLQGEEHETVTFSTWCPKAIAMIGSLHDTLEDRSIVVHLRRKTPDETVYRIGVEFERKCKVIRRACKRWANDNMEKLISIKPDVPITHNDRAVDNWIPILSIADVAGGDWPELMRSSMLGMADGSDDSIGPELLKDIQGIFKAHSVERIFSDDLAEQLTKKEEAPWSDWNRGKGLTQNGLAKQLKQFSITSKTMRIGNERRKGYDLNSFKDAFKRYIPPAPPVQSVTTRQINNFNYLGEKQSVTKESRVTDVKQHNQLNLNDCHVVTDEKGDTGEDTPETDKCHACKANSNGQCYAYSVFDGKPRKPVPCETAVKNCKY